MKRLLIAMCALGIGATVAAFATAASPPVSGGVLGSGNLTRGEATVQFSPSRGYLMEWAKFAPGATSGWHYHRTAVGVLVMSGTLTEYHAQDPSCTPTRYSKGQGFVEPPNFVHVVHNDGRKPVEIRVFYLGVTKKQIGNPTLLDVGAKNPGNCPSSIR